MIRKTEAGLDLLKKPASSHHDQPAELESANLIPGVPGLDRELLEIIGNHFKILVRERDNQPARIPLGPPLELLNVQDLHTPINAFLGWGQTPRRLHVY